MSDFTADDERFGVVFEAVGKSSFAACRRLLVPGGVYMSTGLGPRGQNPLVAIADLLGKLVGARRVLFPIPTRTQDDLVVSIAHRRVEVATLRDRRSVATEMAVIRTDGADRSSRPETLQ